MAYHGCGGKLMDFPEKRKRAYRAAAGNGNVVSVARIANMKLPNPQHGDTWGNWQLDAETLELVYPPERYAIDLESIDSSAEMLDWIIQLSEKSWISRKDVGDLVQALANI